MKFTAGVVLALANSALAAKADDPGTQDPNTIMYNQGKLWVLIVFLALAFVFSAQVMYDNEPDTQWTRSCTPSS